MVLTIGATGHRFLTGQDRLAIAVNEALNHIEQRFGRNSLMVLSSLAEGADRLIAAEVLRRPGAGLTVPLPLPVDDYRQDFSGASASEFDALLGRAEHVVQLPPASTRADAYAAAGHYVVDHCEILVALWDGQRPQGRGGTALMVARARARGIPLAWVHAANRKPGTAEPASIGAEQGALSYEHF